MDPCLLGSFQGKKGRDPGHHSDGVDNTSSWGIIRLHEDREHGGERGESFLSAWDASSAGHEAEGAKLQDQEVLQFTKHRGHIFHPDKYGPHLLQSKPTPHILARTSLQDTILPQPPT